MSNVLIIGNVLKDVYLRLDERLNHFETDNNGTPWLDLGFDGSMHQFFRRISIYGGAAVALEVLNRFDIKASVAGSTIAFKDGEVVPGSQPPACYRYMLCHGNKITYLVPTERTETAWVPPTEALDWIFVDRSAGVTDDLVHELRTYLSMSSHTRLAIYLAKDLTDADKHLLELADMVFCDEDTTGFEYEGALCRISDSLVTLGSTRQSWRIERSDLMTHLTTHSIIATSVFAALLHGSSVREALKFAKINVENATLQGTLTLSSIQQIAKEQADQSSNIDLIAATLMAPGKGILAADESGGSIHKKFDFMHIPDDEQHRRDYRNIFISTPELERYVSGVILFDETARQQADDGRDFVSYLTAHGIVSGIKVDQGLINFPDSTENYTAGLDGLPQRLEEYYNMGLRFAKWRAAFEIGDGKPTDLAIQKNAELLAAYAKHCQDAEMVPIVEPEVVYDGNYTIEQCTNVTGKVLDALFDELAKAGVKLDSCILKCNMVMAGKQYPIQSTPEEVGKATADVLRTHVPENLAGVVFLSGGQTPDQATANLAAVINNGKFPWPVTFSFARALQDPALHAWQGDNNNYPAAKHAFKERLIANTDILPKE